MLERRMGKENAGKKDNSWDTLVWRPSMGRAEEEGGKEKWSKHRNSPPAMWLSVGYCRGREQKSRRVLERGGKVKVIKGAAGEQGGKTSKQPRRISINL